MFFDESTHECMTGNQINWTVSSICKWMTHNDMSFYWTYLNTSCAHRFAWTLWMTVMMVFRARSSWRRMGSRLGTRPRRSWSWGRCSRHGYTLVRIKRTRATSPQSAVLDTPHLVLFLSGLFHGSCNVIEFCWQPMRYPNASSPVTCSNRIGFV